MRRIRFPACFSRRRLSMAGARSTPVASASGRRRKISSSSRPVPQPRSRRRSGEAETLFACISTSSAILAYPSRQPWTSSSICASYPETRAAKNADIGSSGVAAGASDAARAFEEAGAAAAADCSGPAAARPGAGTEFLCANTVCILLMRSPPYYITGQALYTSPAERRTQKQTL